MEIYRAFSRQFIRNCTAGSTVSVLVVGSLFIFSTLEISQVEFLRLAGVLIGSLIIMMTLELFFIRRQIAPIRTLLHALESSDVPSDWSKVQSVYQHVHRLPVLTVGRILGPHLLGLSVPAILATLLLIRLDLLHFPYFYVWLAIAGSLLVAALHAMIEFFLTVQTIKPVLLYIRRRSLDLSGYDPSLNGQIIVSIQKKFQLSAFLIGAFPLFLFALAGQVRLQRLTGQDSMEYWRWAAVIIVIGVAFASLGAWLLSRDVQQPIRNLYERMGSVREGNFDVQAADIYSDEFSKLISGFNHMVNGLKARDRMNSQLIQSYITMLAATLDARDRYTAGHSERVAGYSVQIGWLAGLSLQELDLVKKSALLHDIGKIGVRDSVLLKEGRLTDEEFALIQEHPVLGENILKQIEPVDAMADLMPGVRSHHERYDGKGYPDRLSGDSIPLLGRIIAIADAFDAMTSDRPYRQGMSVEKALLILEEGCGTQWDPKLTPLFVADIREEQRRTKPTSSADAFKPA
ncbi:HD domain-containing phosphohydrolase [Cohnella faecalis]|uniref:HD domain-containing protein n=1 Tax=Cohnella faecalis TaxID=2315694 RepID=A0A398CRX4_9BACL|nr:HD domain-containing phosphohydrolase [Cohnella faecalis]RIE03969.1 HD domain-containing protein [Cohnella faecalis]